MLGDPLQHLGVLVGGIVIDDDMNRLALRHPGIDDVEEADELLMTMTLHALAEDLARKDVERRKQGGDTMPLIIVGHGTDASLLHRQSWLGTIQRLNLALFIDCQHDGMVGRIDVQTNDVLELGGKLRIVGQLKLAHQMRPQAVSAPYPLHRTDADPRRFGHGRAGPVARCRRRFRQRHRHHALGHLRAQRRDARWPRFIAPKSRRAVVPESLLPPPDHRLGFTGCLHDLGSAATIGGQKNDFRPPNVLLRAIAVGHHCFKLGAVGGAQSDIRSLVHPADSHTRVRRGIPQRIEMLDLVH